MKFRIPLLLLFLVALCLILVLRFGLRAQQEPEIPNGNPKTTRVQFPVKDEDFDWDKVDKEDLKELADWFSEGTPNEERVEFSAVLSPGEEMILDGSEMEPGVFEFSRMKPEIVEDPQVGKAIFIKTQRFTVSIDGSETILTMPAITLKDGAEGTISVGGPGVIHSIEIQAELDGESIRLSGATIEERLNP